MSFNKLKVAELKAECEKLGLETTGTKAVLVARLEAHGGGEDEDVPKAKATTAPKKGKKAAKKRTAGAIEEEEEELAAPVAKIDPKAELAKKAKAATKAGGGARRKDPGCSLPGDVYQEYQATLNQTNIGANNNKFYIVEIHQSGSSFRVWTHWGRVGESGQHKAEGSSSAADAIKGFEKKFKEKTGNAWSARDSFVPKPGKYTMLEMADGDDGNDEEIIGKLDALQSNQAATAAKYAKSTLAKPVQELVSLIFNHDMFKEQMAKLNIDTAKMPLGKLSHGQILKGYETLEELEKAIEAGKKADIERLTGQFYTQIPHSFGRSQPPLLRSIEDVQSKYDMLNILGDIESATKSEAASSKKAQVAGGELPNPIDVSYGTLDCDISPLDPKSAEYKIIKEYTENTGNSGGWRNCKIVEVFEINRKSEGKRFDAHKGTDNRKLLWHGTNVAVVAAILKTGLRIMPHSGGRVGKGIYSASENSKSAGYVGTTSDGTGIMFLNEVVLGKEHHITRDDSSLTVAPKGCLSVIAQGQTDPDPKGDKTLKMGGHSVVVPTGKPIHRPQYAASSFSQSEFLVYNENQIRMRYMIRAKFN